MRLAKKILSNTFYQVVAKFITALIGALTVKVLTTYLGATVFGEYTFIYEYLAFFGIAADFGLFTISVREISKYEGDDEKINYIFGNIFGLRICLTLMMMLLACLTIFLLPIILNKETNEFVQYGVLIAVFSTFFTIVNGTLTSVLQAKLKMFASMIAQTLGKICIFSYMIYTVFILFPNDNIQGFYHILLAGIIGNFVMFVITWFATKRLVIIKPLFDFKYYKEISKQSLPYGLALILNTVYFRVDSVLLYMMKGPTEVGVYGVAMRVLEILAALPLFFMNSVLPPLSKSIHDKTQKYKQIIQLSFDFLIINSFPILVGGFILAYSFVFVISSPEFLSRISEGFYGSDIAIQILMFALVFQFLNTLFIFIIISLNKQSKILWINLGVVVFNIITNLIFIPHYGFRGAAVTSVISEMLILLFTFITVKKYLDFNISLNRTWRSFLAVSVMGGVIYFLKPLLYEQFENWSLFILILIGAFVYLLSLFLFGAINIKMLKSLLRR